MCHPCHVSSLSCVILVMCNSCQVLHLSLLRCLFLPWLGVSLLQLLVVGCLTVLVTAYTSLCLLLQVTSDSLTADHVMCVPCAGLPGHQPPHHLPPHPHDAGPPQRLAHCPRRLQAPGQNKAKSQWNKTFGYFWLWYCYSELQNAPGQVVRAPALMTLGVLERTWWLTARATDTPLLRHCPHSLRHMIIFDYFFSWYSMIISSHDNLSSIKTLRDVMKSWLGSVHTVLWRQAQAHSAHGTCGPHSLPNSSKWLGARCG